MTDWTFEEAIDRHIAITDAVAAEQAKHCPPPLQPDISKLPPEEREAYQAWWERFQAGLHNQERKHKTFIAIFSAPDSVLAEAQRTGEPWVKPFTEDEEKELRFWYRRLKELGAFDEAGGAQQ